MLFKNITTGETTHNRALAMAWYRQGHGDPVEVYRWNDPARCWEFACGWVLL